MVCIKKSTRPYSSLLQWLGRPACGSISEEGRTSWTPCGHAMAVPGRHGRVVRFVRRRKEDGISLIV